MIYRYNNTLARNGTAELYKGLLVEVQIRTKEQHTWATPVETMSLILDQPFKTRGGSKDWNEFFALMSSAIAIVENTNVLEKHEKLSPIDIYKKIAVLSKKMKALDLMRGYSFAANVIQQEKTGFYNIIILNTKDKTVRIISYPKNNYKKAVSDYSKEEQKAEDHIDVVLVSVGKLSSLKQAYPNYFLDIKDFAERIEVISRVIEEQSKE